MKYIRIALAVFIITALFSTACVTEDELLTCSDTAQCPEGQICSEDGVCIDDPSVSANDDNIQSDQDDLVKSDDSGEIPDNSDDQSSQTESDTPDTSGQSGGDDEDIIDTPEDKDSESPDTGGSNTGDKTPPEITSVSPAEDAVDVPVDTEITITFSESMDLDSVKNSANFIVKDGDAAVTGTIVFVAESGNYSATFSPDNNVTAGSLITVTVKDMTDRNNNSLAESKIWSFTTKEDKTGPILVESKPDADSTSVPPFITMSLTFDEPVINVTTETVKLFEGDSAVAIDLNVNSNNMGCTFTAQTTYNNGNLKPLTSYSIIIANTVTDQFGNTLQTDGAGSLEIPFTTSDNMVFYEDFEDSGSHSMWKEINVISIMDNQNPFHYKNDLWEIGTPSNCKVTQAYEGNNMIGTVIDGMLPETSWTNASAVILSNILYYDEKITVPSNGMDLELYAFVDTAFPSEQYKGGVAIYLCEDTVVTEGGKCSKMQVDPASTRMDFSSLQSSPSGFVHDFTGVYSSEQHGISGQAEPNTFVKITGSIGSEAAGKSVYLMFEYTQDGHGNPDNCGVYLDNISLIAK